MGCLEAGVGQKIPHEQTIYAGSGVREMVNDYKTTAHVGHIDVAVDGSS
jgi:hypothetical protein